MNSTPPRIAGCLARENEIAFQCDTAWSPRNFFMQLSVHTLQTLVSALLENALSVAEVFASLSMDDNVQEIEATFAAKQR